MINNKNNKNQEGKKIGESPVTARASGNSLPMSLKYAVNITKEIRGKNIYQARRILEDSIKMSRPVKFHRDVNGVGHKRGMGPGRYAPKTCENILSVLNSAVANAEHKGLSTKNLYLKSIVPSKGPTIPRPGRGGHAKRTNLTITIGEATK